MGKLNFLLGSKPFSIALFLKSSYFEMRMGGEIYRFIKGRNAGETQTRKLHKIMEDRKVMKEYREMPEWKILTRVCRED